MKLCHFNYRGLNNIPLGLANKDFFKKINLYSVIVMKTIQSQ